MISIKTYILAAVFTLCIAIFFSCRTTSQKQEPKTESTVQISGAMRNVMWKGELFGTIDCDTIADKTHLYGLGPVEYLTGEILIIDGVGYFLCPQGSEKLGMEICDDPEGKGTGTNGKDRGVNSNGGKLAPRYGDADIKNKRGNCINKFCVNDKYH